MFVYIGGGHLGGSDAGKEFRGAEIHIHPSRIKVTSCMIAAQQSYLWLTQRK